LSISIYSSVSHDEKAPSSENIEGSKKISFALAGSGGCEEVL
jgi:hypothetical protein